MSSQNKIQSGIIREAIKLAIWIILFIIIEALVHILLTEILSIYGINIADYEVYLSIGLTLIFGYLIVNSFSIIIYNTLKPKYGHSAALSMRNLIKLFGVGALLSGIAGGVAGGAAGVALGGFIGMVIGFASKDVLSQILSGILILMSRPFKVGDSVNITGESGVISEISTLYTFIKKEDGSVVLIPNNKVMGQKIIIKSF